LDNSLQKSLQVGGLMFLCWEAVSSLLSPEPKRNIHCQLTTVCTTVCSVYNWKMDQAERLTYGGWLKAVAEIAQTIVMCLWHTAVQFC